MGKRLVPAEVRGIVAHLWRAGYTPADIERATEGAVSRDIARRLINSIRNRPNA